MYPLRVSEQPPVQVLFIPMNGTPTARDQSGTSTPVLCNLLISVPSGCFRLSGQILSAACCPQGFLRPSAFSDHSSSDRSHGQRNRFRTLSMRGPGPSSKIWACSTIRQPHFGQMAPDAVGMSVLFPQLGHLFVLTCCLRSRAISSADRGLRPPLLVAQHGTRFKALRCLQLLQRHTGLRT